MLVIAGKPHLLLAQLPQVLESSVPRLMKNFDGVVGVRDTVVEGGLVDRQLEVVKGDWEGGLDCREELQCSVVVFLGGVEVYERDSLGRGADGLGLGG